MSSHACIDVATWTADEHQQQRCACGAFAVGSTDSADRLMLNIDSVSTDKSTVRIQNLGGACQLAWHDQTLAKCESVIVTLPAHVALGQHHLEIRRPDWLTSCGVSLRTIKLPDQQPGAAVIPLNRLGSSPGPKTLSRWFAALQALHYDRAGSPAFFSSAAQAVTNPGGMTAGMVLLRDDDDWRIVGSHVPDPLMGIAFSDELLQRVVSDRCTHYHEAVTDPRLLPTEADSVVAAPVLNQQHSVVGAVYGYRSRRNQNKRHGIRAFEALWIQLVASSVSAALTRQDAEAELARKTVLLEQVFAPQVVQEIARNPQALAGQERETTILFVDLRDSSAISQRLNTADNYRLLGQLLEALTRQVMDNTGVIIDYYGDGLAAMWNAPTDQPDHTRLACQAALGMVRDVELLNERWSDRVGSQLAIGVGINTGICRVGNSGTKWRLKYGPRGKTVVLASRLESATKHLGTTVLLSEAAVNRLGPNSATRRVCRAQLPGVVEPIDIYELCALDAGAWATELTDFIAQYQYAVDLFEAGELAKSEKLLAACAGSRMSRQFPAKFMLQEVKDRRERQRRSDARKRTDRRAPNGIVDLASLFPADSRADQPRT